jgi:flavin reductase (DIM6/NTAB) family NADH-FMN oxidoreductase RutF
MRNYPTGVVVISCFFNDFPYGVTMNSFLSISLNPQLIGFFINNNSFGFKVFSEVGRFVVNILAEDQAEIAKRFSTLNPNERFKSVDYSNSEFGPIIKGIVAHLNCEVISRITIADHSLIIGEVKEAEILSKKKPLVYYNRTYTRPE